MKRTFRALAGLAALFALACGERDSDLAQGFDLMAPAAIDEHVVFVDRGHQRAHILPVSTGNPTADQVIAAVPANPRAHALRNGHPEELLVLCAGSIGDGEEEHEPAALAVLNAEGIDRVYTFDSQFTSMTQSEDGRRVFLFFDPAAAAQVDSLLFNQNEVAIIDLDQPPAADNPTLRTLSSFGGVPEQVVFSPAMEIAGTTRDLAIVLFDSDVAVWDLSNIERPEYTIELSRRTTGSIALEQVLFGIDEQNIYLRGSASNDVFVVSLSASTAGTQNDFAPSINQLEAGVGPADMVLYDEVPTDALPGGRRLFVVAEGSAQGLVVDNASSRVTAIALPASPNRILRFDAGKIDDPEPEQRALLYRDGTDTVVFVDLEGLEDRGSRNVELLRLSSTYGRVLKLSEELALLVHQSQGLSLIDLVQRTVQPIQSSQSLVSAVSAHGMLWLAPPGQDRVGFLDLQTFHPSEVRLDAVIRDGVAVPSESQPRFVLTHESSIGYFTVLDGEDPAHLEAAYSVQGFLLDDLLGGSNR